MSAQQHIESLALAQRSYEEIERTPYEAQLLQTHRWPEVLIGSVAGLTSLSALYLIKCAAGINLLPGQAPVLHGLLYHFIQ
jgi:hypothetical protein